MLVIKVSNLYFMFVSKVSNSYFMFDSMVSNLYFVSRVSNLYFVSMVCNLMFVMQGRCPILYVCEQDVQIIQHVKVSVTSVQLIHIKIVLKKVKSNCFTLIINT